MDADASVNLQSHDQARMCKQLIEPSPPAMLKCSIAALRMTPSRAENRPGFSPDEAANSKSAAEPWSVQAFR